MPHIVVVAGVVCEQFYSHFKIRIHIFPRKHFLPAFAIFFFFSSSFSFFVFIFPPTLEHCEMFSFSCLNLQRFVVADVIKQQDTKLAEVREERRGKEDRVNWQHDDNKQSRWSRTCCQERFQDARDHRETRLRDHIRSA